MGQDSNTRQAAWAAVSGFCSFAFGLVSSMILSRYFDKIEYGTYKQVLYIYNTLLSVFTLGLPKSYSFFLPRVTIEQGRNLVRKITNILFVLGGIFSLTLFLGSDLIANFLCNPELSFNLRVFSIVPLVMLPTMGLEGILATYRKTKMIAIYTFLTRVGMLIFVIVPVLLFDAGCMGALLGFACASIISFFIALYMKNYPFRGINNRFCEIQYKEILRFALPLFWAGIWGMVIFSSDQFFVSRFWGIETFAEFSNGFMEIPLIGMVVGACSTVLSPIFSKMSENVHMNLKQVLYPLWLSVYKKTVLALYPILVFCCFFADIVIVFLYGEQYVNSSVYFRWKLFGCFFTVMVYAPLLINMGKVKFYARVHMIGAFVLVFFECLAGYLFQSPYSIAIISTMCLLGRVFCMLYVIAKCFDVRIYQLFPYKDIFKVTSLSIAVSLMVRLLLIDNINIDYVFLLPLSFIVYAILYFLLATFFKLNYFSLINPLINKRK